jgi:putative nucleotidyltransferase with HDIG domain
MEIPMQERKIPSRSECLRLMKQHGMLENIVNHSLEVTRVALFLSRELNQRGQRVDVALVEAAALLHDLAKTECLLTREDHARSGYELLRRIGYEIIGEVVAQHIWMWERGDPERVSEEELVNYADKRVRHDQIVSLRERFIDLRDRYGKGPEALRYLEALETATFEIEQKIFFILGMDPDDLGRLQEGPIREEGSKKGGEQKT